MVPMRLVTLSLLLLTACGGAVPGRDMAPTDHAERRLDRAVRTADNEANRLEDLPVLGRYSPTSCGCPPWELRVGGRWQRVALEGAPDVPLEAGALVDLVVDVTNDVVEADNGWRYLVFEVTSFEVR